MLRMGAPFGLPPCAAMPSPRFQCHKSFDLPEVGRTGCGAALRHGLKAVAHVLPAILRAQRICGGRTGADHTKLVGDRIVGLERATHAAARQRR